VNGVAYYRDQARLIREWRATRLALIRRSLLSAVATGAALLIISTLSPDLDIDGLTSVVLAAVLITLLNSLLRPALLLAFAPLPAIAVPIVGLLMQIPIVLLTGAIVPGVHVGTLDAAVRDAVLLTVLNAIMAEILRASDDDSYHGTQVRRLAGREFGQARTVEPGLLMVQLDGLSRPVLENQMRAGRMPTLARLVQSGGYRLDPWFTLLPPVTPVSQAGILHGDNDDMPGFRWFEKSSKTLLVANTPEGASEIVTRRSNGHGLLADDGASIGNLVTGDAARSYLTMATIMEDTPAPDDPRRLRGIFVSQVNYIRLFVLTLGEVAKELYQRERQRGRGIEPRIRRDFHYAFERALTNVSLRNLTTALVIEEMFGRAPSIYVDYTGYDALAHHVGPERAEAVDALDGLDRTIRSLMKAARETPRPYTFVFLSDHGQCLGRPFTQLYGELLEDVARRLMNDVSPPLRARRAWEYGGTGRVILGELGRGRGARQALARRAARRRRRQAPASEEGELVACASGNLALLYMTMSDDRVDREDIDLAYPALIPGLVEHPGVGLVMCHSRTDGPVAISRSGEHFLASGRVVGTDPLGVFGPLALESLRRLDAFCNTGDLTVIGPYDAETGQVVSYEDLVGSHGGLGGWQSEPFLLHPFELAIEGTLVGAVSVHDTLRRWLRSLRSDPTDLGTGVSPGPVAVGGSARGESEDAGQSPIGTRAASEGTPI
jgi:uncharacterized membrane protein YvlD (DUF360 family)